MILFSIPVHECPDVIINQVENFTHFNPGCQIVLHVSRWMGKPEHQAMKDALKRCNHVHFNDVRLWTGHADGTQMKMHVLNSEYANKIGLNYKYLCIHASNDMFVRSGLVGYVSKYDGGYSVTRQENWLQLTQAKNDVQLRKMMAKLKIPEICGGQIEGSFYKKEIFDKVAKWIREEGYYEIPHIYAHGTIALNHVLLRPIINHFIKPLIKGMLYAKEEIYFSTLSQKLVKRKAPYNYCYINWNEGGVIKKEEVDAIRERDYQKLPFINSMPSMKELELFAVKRIDRRIDDPMRRYITSLQ